MNPLIVPPLLALSGFLIVQFFLSERGAGVVIEEGRAQWRSGLASLRRDSPHCHRSWLLLSVWLAAFTGDAVTTSIGLHSGVGHEANPLAAFSFGFLGPDVAMALVSVVFLACSFFTLTRPRHRVLYFLVVPLWLVLAVKVFAVCHNLMVLRG